ncbi:MAG: diaminopimelate epimerase [Alphaproteobacteria bacterium]|nr:diaminopimelate epimerase [Alphaproteobacteria bacterium]
MTTLKFRKMHGLGNDFVVLDGRRASIALPVEARRSIADRRRGIGCDQLITLEPSSRADVFMRIHNADGSEAGACGNATRCVADLILKERGGERATVETISGLLAARRTAGGRIAVDMGPARTGWREIPLAREMDTLHLDLALDGLADPVATNMGNPHCTFFVADAEAIDLVRLGPRLEHDPLFPERANIGIAEIIDRRRIRLRVWERGVGLTLACGSGACAALVAAARRGLTDRAATVRVDGGELDILWRDDGRVEMTGPVALAFEGVVEA